MDNLLIEIIKQRFTEIKSQDIFTANEMLLNLNHTTHLEHLNELLGSEIIDNPDVVPTRILEIFEQSLFDVLVAMFIVPDVTDFNALYNLVSSMYRLENYLDHQVVLDEIEDMAYLEAPRDTLIHLLEKLFNQDWGSLNENIRDVRQTLITLIVKKHTDALLVEVDEGHDNLIRTRERANTRFFTLHPQTIIANLITSGNLPVPVETDKALSTVTPIIYSMENLQQIAVEILALAFIAPVKLQSIPLHAKTIINKLYIDVNTVTALTLEVDRLVREGGLTND